MGALVNKVRDDYAVSNHKEFIVSSEEDFAMLPTSTEKGTFGVEGLDDVCAVGSIAYTDDFNIVKVLGLDNTWKVV